MDDIIVVENARKAVNIELATKRAMGYSINEFDVKTKTIYRRTPNGKVEKVATSKRGRYSERRK